MQFDIVSMLLKAGKIFKARRMTKQAKITLKTPHYNKKDHYLSFRLQQQVINQPSIYQSSKKVFGISDIEGNFSQLCKILIKSKVIDKYLRWTFQDNRLVIVGDCFDRGEQVTECLWLIYSLEEKAQREGGYVHFILGNHEIMNMNGDWRYVHPKYARKKPGSKSPATALYYGNDEIWRWLKTKNIIEKIGNFLFVHGGIAPQLLHLNLSIEEINNLARPWYAAASQTHSDPVLNTLFNSHDSPFWYRGYYRNALREEIIDATLAHFGVKTIVTGHTVVEHICSLYNNKIININTDHASGRSEALLIEEPLSYRVNSSGERECLINNV